MKQFLAFLACSVLLGACGNEVVVEQSESPDNGGSSSASSSSGSTSGGGNACVPDEAPFNANPTCDDMVGIVLEDATITGDEDGDGYLEPGEFATLTITMRDGSGKGFNYYPGIKFSSSKSDIPPPDDFWFYAILPCGAQPADSMIRIPPQIASGTDFTIHAQLAMLNQECPDAFAIDIPMYVY